MSETASVDAAGSERVAGSSQALVVVDDDCVCIEASLGACRLLGAARSDIVGHSVEELLEPDSRERWSHVWRAFRTAGGHAEPFALEAPATVAEVSLSVTAGVLPERHLIGFDATRGRASTNVAPPVGRQPSTRERQILGLLAGGATDGQIAAMLELSPATVQTHVRNAKAKLGARTRAQAVAMALQQGLIEAR